MVIMMKMAVTTSSRARIAKTLKANWFLACAYNYWFWSSICNYESAARLPMALPSPMLLWGA